ncbi:MAG: endolytic transglycosylase MltG [Pseudomonadota bacterium]
MKKVFLAALLLAVAGVSLAVVVLRSWWHTPVAGVNVVLTVRAGSSIRSVAEDLSRQQLLRWPQLWLLLARWQGQDEKIQRGEYDLQVSRSPQQLLDMLVQGNVITYSLTLAEGLTFQEAFSLVQSQAKLSKRLNSSQDPALLSLIAPREHLEGLFFPDTYVYRLGDSDLDILSQAHRRMQSVLEQAWTGRAVGLPYSDPYEALIMASIVEKETGLPTEREQIAGVFVRRLENGMRLQTDPTVIYGLGEGFDGNLRRRHLNDLNNIYNTYRHSGLPPTPIALPGRAALRAALQPADGEALYFVARGDGSHQFSATLADHEAAVRKYQLRRRADYRSAPAQQGEG